MRGRRWLFTPVILVGTAALWWWGGEQAERRAERVTWFVRNIVTRGELPHAADMRWSRDHWPPGLDDQLAAVRRDLPGSGLEIHVEPGDVALYGDGRATHHAVLAVGTAPRLGLRLIYEDPDRQRIDQVHIIGFWDPAR